MAGSIWTLTEQQCQNAQAKITYLGEQTKPVPTVLFGVTRKFSIADFLKVQRSRSPYDNDTMPYTKTFTVSVEEFRRILAAVQPVVSGAPERHQDLSFAVMSELGDEVIGEEFLISRAHGEAFYRALLGGISQGNEAARTILIDQYKNIYPG